MQTLNSLTTYIILGFAATALWAPLLINLLYRLNIVVKHILIKQVNQEFYKIHGHKSGTPTMGGLMISVTVAALTLLFIPYSNLRSVFLIGWILFTLYGLFDGLLAMARRVSQKLLVFDESFGWRMLKLFVLFGVGIGVCAIAFSNLGIKEISLIGSIVMPVNTFTTVLFGAGMVLAMYGMEITDGADGLVTGKFLIALVTYLVISILSGHLELVPFIALTIGSSFVYLYFNIHPARVFMGGTGTLPIGFLLVLSAYITNSLFPFLIMGVVFWAELFSSASQIIAIRFFKRRIFRIAPLHHYFEAIGWDEAKVVQRFWLAAAVMAVLALWVFTLL